MSTTTVSVVCNVPGVSFLAETQQPVTNGALPPPTFAPACTHTGGYGLSAALGSFGPNGADIGLGATVPDTEFLAAFSTPTPFVTVDVTGVNIPGGDAPELSVYDANGNHINAFCEGPGTVEGNTPTGPCYTTIGPAEYQYTITAPGIAYAALNDNVVAVNSVTFDPPSVPEPSTLSLLALSLLCAGLLARACPRGRAA